MDTSYPSEIGPYQVLRPLGAGGMGLVLLASRAGAEAHVAVKLLRAEGSQDPHLRARLIKEAAVLSRLSHPAVVRLLDWGKLADETLYLVMELLPGPSLRGYQRDRGPLPLEVVLAIGCQVSGALAAVHQLEIVHRDLKPENILLLGMPQRGAPPHIKLVDFGLAKAPPLGAGSQTELATSSAAYLGTALYMAPEQFHSAAQVTGAADVYALGLILYELLLGVLPFTAEPWAALQWHQGGGLPAWNTGVPFWVSALIERMLARDPGRRPSMREVLARLSDPAPRWSMQGAAARMRAAARRVPRPWALALLLGATGVSGGLVIHRQREAAAADATVPWLSLLQQMDREISRQPGTLAARRQALLAGLARVREPRVPEEAQELARIYHRFSELEMNHGLTRDARRWQEAAAHLLPAAGAALRPALGYWEGGLCMQEGRLNAAEAAYNDVLTLLGPAPQPDGELRAVAIAQEGLGQVRLHRGDLRGAGAAFAAADQSEQTRSGPQDGMRRYVRSYHLYRLGEVAELEQRWSEARYYYREAFKAGRPLLGGPSAQDWAHLGRVAAHLAWVYLHTSESEGAEAAMAQALGLAEKVWALEPSPQHALIVSEIDVAVGEIEQARGGSRQAAWGRAIERLRHLRQGDPSNGLAAHDLLIVYARMVDLARRAKDSSAEQHLRTEADELIRSLERDRQWEGDWHLRVAKRRLDALDAGVP